MKKLTPYIVEGVRVDKAAGMRQCAIAVKYGISAGSVSRILLAALHCTPQNLAKSALEKAPCEG